jgi:hypothetical protein
MAAIKSGIVYIQWPTIKTMMYYGRLAYKGTFQT